MSKIIGFVFLAVLVGSSVVAWSRSTATGSHEAKQANQLRAFAPDEMHKTAAVRSLHPQKIDDMSVVFSEER
jgi:type II secretory pathway component PulL